MNSNQNRFPVLIDHHCWVFGVPIGPSRPRPHGAAHAGLPRGAASCCTDAQGVTLHAPPCRISPVRPTSLPGPFSPVENAGDCASPSTAAPSVAGPLGGADRRCYGIEDPHHSGTTVLVMHTGLHGGRNMIRGNISSHTEPLTSHGLSVVRILPRRFLPGDSSDNPDHRRPLRPVGRMGRMGQLHWRTASRAVPGGPSQARRFTRGRRVAGGPLHCRAASLADGVLAAGVEGGGVVSSQGWSWR
jgi:hypothetical protein